MPEAVRASDATPGIPPDPRAPAPRSWIAPLISTLLTLPMAFFALVFAGLSQMACGSCGETDQSRFDPSFDTAFTVFGCGLTVPAVLLLLSWTLPWQRRYAARRVLFAVAAFFAVPFLYLLFLGLVDWPA